MEQQTPPPFNRYRNHARAIELGNPMWQKSQDAGLIGLSVSRNKEGKLVTEDGHPFMNFSSCDYLGLHSHPKVTEGAINAMRSEGYMMPSSSPLRIAPSSHFKLERMFSELLDATILLNASCSAISAGVLPLLAAGAVSDGEKPVMIFDRFCHFSMAVTMPMCADETHVHTCKNNDLNFIEDMCRKHPRVAYVSDGSYSMGGHSLIKNLMDLQNRYGLHLYLDDSHSFSMHGTRGEGFVRSHLPEVNDRTMICASMGKAFGAGGGVIMLGPNKKNHELLRRFAGPWSQCMTIPVLGAAIASAEIHFTPELGELQNTLRQRIAYFDSIMESSNKDEISPIRIVPVGEEDKALTISQALFKRGFYSSAVFFPIVPRGKAGLRIMMRANQTEDEITELCSTLTDILRDFGVVS